MTLNDLVKIAHANAVKKGWWDTGRSHLEIAALVHSEVSEFVEEVRNDAPPIYQRQPAELADFWVPPESPKWQLGLKPEGQAIELADAIIRIADYFGQMGWDLTQAIELKMGYNTGREYRHGGKVF